MLKLVARVSLLILVMQALTPSFVLAQEDEGKCPNRSGQDESSICTREYAPVCGTIRVGNRVQHKTYANACEACKQPSISTYSKGECAALGR